MEIGLIFNDIQPVIIQNLIDLFLQLGQTPQR